MATFTIRQTVAYEAQIEAATEQEARDIYLRNQEAYYAGVESEDIEKE